MRVNAAPRPRPVAATFGLDSSLCFLNHGSFGATPRIVLDEQSRLRDHLERDPVHFLVRELPRRQDAARAAVARFVGARPESLAFVTNATAAVSGVLRSLTLEAGDELIVTDHGYGACTNAARAVAASVGARVVVAPVPVEFHDAEQVTRAILAAVTPKTKLALVDHVTSPTACVFPIASIVARLRDIGVECLVDGAHAPGMLPLDLEALGALAYTGNLHKWPCAPKGVGFLWVRDDAQRWVRPAVISHGSPDPGRRFRAEHDWTGTADPTPALVAPLAIDVVGGLMPGGWQAVRAHNHATAVLARTLLNERFGIVAPYPADCVGSMALVRLPAPASPAPGANEIEPLQEQLFSRYGIEVPLIRWPNAATRWVRVSIHLYNRLEQVAYLADALTELLRTE